MQSWLASTLYGVVDDWWGGAGLRVLMGLSTAGLMAIVWRLLRPTQGLLLRIALGALVLGIGASQWSERPLLIGLLAIGAAVLAAEGGLDPRWLVPVGWVWVNSHGSFPLGVVYLAVVALGTRLDGEDVTIALRSLRWMVVGVVLGAINPLGPRLLLFPLELVQRQDVLRHVVEWQSPGFRSLGERLFLLQVLLTIVALVARPRYRSGLVVAVFVAAALLGSRNIAVASLVLVPVLARAWPALGSFRSDVRGGPARMGSVAAVALALVITVGRLGQPHYDDRPYPVELVRYLDRNEVDLTEVRLGGPERVGNLLELLHGPRGEVFVDDRFDLQSDAVSDDLVTLLGASTGARRVLDRWDLSLVLWPRSAALSQVLLAAPEWRVLAGEEAWLLFCREGAELGGDLGRC